MNKYFTYGLIFSIGILLGTIFFGGLWLTVKKGILSKYPAIWFALSLIIRMAVVLGGFYYVVQYISHGEPAVRILVCLAGLLVARKVITKRGGLDNFNPVKSHDIDS